MGLTLKKEPSGGVREAVLPPRVGRNEVCHCGSGRKYKRCCGEGEEALRRKLRGEALPKWIEGSRGKLQQFEKYVTNVSGLPDLLASLVDTRRAPKIPTFDVVNSLFHTAVLRIRSLNALEGDLKRSDFQRLIGRQPRPEVGYFNYHAVPSNLASLRSFRLEVRKRWLHVIRRRSQRSRMTWELLERLAVQWLPIPKILHPYTHLRFDARHLRVKAVCTNERPHGSARGALGNWRPYRNLLILAYRRTETSLGAGASAFAHPGPRSTSPPLLLYPATDEY
jgi:SEC-C motif